MNNSKPPSPNCWNSSAIPNRQLSCGLPDGGGMSNTTKHDTMKLQTIAQLGAAVLATAFLPSCIVDASGGAGSNRQHQGYTAPARVTQLKNGNFLTTIDGKLLSFDSTGRLTSSGTANPSEVYHAQEAVNSYMRGHRGDYMHPNYNYQSSTPPEVRPRGDGKIEVLMPKGGVVLYDANGRLIQKGGTVSGAELYDANKAVQSYLRENNSSRGYSDV